MKDIYLEPFLNSWPTPFSIKDIRECFKINRSRGKIRGIRKSQLFNAPENSGILNFFEPTSKAWPR